VADDQRIGEVQVPVAGCRQVGWSRIPLVPGRQGFTDDAALVTGDRDCLDQSGQPDLVADQDPADRAPAKAHGEAHRELVVLGHPYEGAEQIVTTDVDDALSLGHGNPAQAI
jgi:hypothetical protein